VDDLTPLLVAGAAGDRRALERFVAASQSDVWRFCASLVGRGQADDATQETFVRIWRAAHGFRAESSARTWQLSIARRVCSDLLRRRSRHDGPRVGPIRAGAVEADSAGALALTDLIRRLDPDRREAFVLTQLHGLSYQQTAEVCGCPVGTVRSRVARARATLAAAVDEAADGCPTAGRRGG
jgi:RNA polymerase sigma-70 factor (ECF subfamily)